jgi:hypothetical protein
LWTCRTPLGKADAFEKHLLATGVAEVERTPGNLGATVLRRDSGGVAHFVMVSYGRISRPSRPLPARTSTGPGCTATTS